MSFVDFEIRVVKLDEENFAVIVMDAPEVSLRLSHKVFRRIFRIPKAQLLKVSPPDLSLVVEGRDRVLRFPRSLVGQSETDFGTFLFKQLLWQHEDLHGVWGSFQHQKWKRLKLCLADELGFLPWETLYDDQEVNGFLALSDVSVVRYVQMSPYLGPLDVGEKPLRMLVVFADPEGDLSQAPANGRKSYIEAEKEAISRALKPLTDKGDLKIDWVEPSPGLTTLQQIRSKIANNQYPNNQYHILHYFGHGSSDKQGVLHLESGRKGDPFPVGFDQLGSILRDTRGSLRLVILNACELARPDVEVFELTPFTNLAASFLNDGAAMVIAMQYPIRKETAPQFTSVFYQYLHPHLFASTARVEDAVLTARRQIAVSPSSVEWITPVVFTRMADDAIFQISEERLRKYTEERQRQEGINRLLREARQNYGAERWVEAAKKVKEILQKDPASEEGKVLREKLIKKAIELVKNLDPRGKEIHRILKDL